MGDVGASHLNLIFSNSSSSFLFKLLSWCSPLDTEQFVHLASLFLVITLLVFPYVWKELNQPRDTRQVCYMVKSYLKTNELVRIVEKRHITKMFIESIFDDYTMYLFVIQSLYV